jgi:hypothetical protein
MKGLKVVLLIVLLLSVLIVVGCEESYSSKSYSTGSFAWEQSATGFWQPNVAHRYSSDADFELSRR